MPRVKAHTIVEVDIEVWCDTCGANLSESTHVDSDDVHVKACSVCIAKAHGKGYDDGYYVGRREEVSNK